MLLLSFAEALPPEVLTTLKPPLQHLQANIPVFFFVFFTAMLDFRRLSCIKKDRLVAIHRSIVWCFICLYGRYGCLGYSCSLDPVSDHVFEGVYTASSAGEKR